MSSVGIFVAMGKNGAEYADFLYETFNLTKSNQHDITFNQIINGNNTPATKWNIIDTVEFIKPNYASVGDAGTHNHCACLNQIQQYAAQYDYIVVCDTDFAMCYHDWDSYIINEFVSNNNLGIFGVPYHPGPTNGTNYQHFPSAFFLCVPSHIWHRVPIYFAYDPDIHLDVNTDELSKCYGVPIGSKIVKDTGYNLPRDIHNAKLEWMSIPYKSHP